MTDIEKLLESADNILLDPDFITMYDLPDETFELVKLAQALLTDLANGFVLVKAEAIYEVCEIIRDGCWCGTAREAYKAAIAASPQSETAKLMGGE